MPGFELFGESEKSQVQDVLDSGVLMRYGFDGMRNNHWKALELEEALSKRMESKYAQLVSSGTAALTVALASAGVGAGDEVIMPTFTFVASFESILAIGAIPILADVDELLLIEDACQAIGGSYDGKPLGSYGDLGCFSFDYVKTITCGEGGAIITNNELYKINADHYSDHGHDHVGNNRGTETHPFLGYNFRISELHAAVGCAQIARLDDFLSIQKRNYTVLRKALSPLSNITFRKVPEGGVENYSFISFFLPTTEIAKKAHTALGEAGVDACFYWFDNNWHYYKKWEHLTQKRSLGKLPQEVINQLPDYSQSDFSKSDAWIGRTISCLVKLSWTEEEVSERATKMKYVLEKFI